MSKVYENSGSLVSSIPRDQVELSDLAAGDKLYWQYSAEAGYFIVRIRRSENQP